MYLFSSAAADLNSYIATLAFSIVAVFITQETSANITILAGEDRHVPLYLNGPLVKNKRFATLPNDPDASCEHSNIGVKFHISPEGKVFALRLLDPSKDYLYLAAIAEVMSDWRFKPKMKDGLADTMRNVVYDFSMKKEFVPCVHSSLINEQHNKAMQPTGRGLS